jgi:F0F1-type ATP synthase delta subunit
MNSIISHIDERLRSVKKSITLINIVHEITEAWTQEITQILQERFKSETETTCDITDLVKGKIAFNNADDLLKAV